MAKHFTKSFTQQTALPPQAIQAAVEVMQSGRLHRYNVIEGETSQAALLEHEFAHWQGAKYCLACASGGYAMHIALRSAGVQDHEPVLTNAFTLAPVPGAIDNAGGKPVLIETGPDLTIDLADLDTKAGKFKPRFLLLSHMRGHIGDMDAVLKLCKKHNLTLIEDCAHTMGARWKNTNSGNFGKIACFSSQTYKHLNSGEGGFLTTNDPHVFAKAVILSGSYMLYEHHLSRPDLDVFDAVRLHTPNYSGRMDNLRAAILRPQLKQLDQQCKRWNQLYRILAEKLASIEGINMPYRAEHEHFVGSSIQFMLDTGENEQVVRFADQCARQGVVIKWFGDSEPRGYTSRFDSWRYFDQAGELPKTMRTLQHLCDMRIPLSFDADDCRLIGEIIEQAVAAIR